MASRFKRFPRPSSDAYLASSPENPPSLPKFLKRLFLLLLFAFVGEKRFVLLAPGDKKPVPKF